MPDELLYASSPNTAVSMGLVETVYGLYESFAATCDVNLTRVSIQHDHFVARDDAHALEIGRQKAGMLDVTVRRVMDVRPMP